MAKEGGEGGDRHLSITGKMVQDDQLPTHTMSYARPVPLTKEQQALGFDKAEEEVAACSIRNISKKETKRREKISNVGLMLTIVSGAFFIIKDKEIPRYFRFAMSGPIGLWIGFYLSAKAGI